MSGYKESLIKNRAAYERLSGKGPAGIEALEGSDKLDYRIDTAAVPGSGAGLKYHEKTVETGVLKDISGALYDYKKLEGYVNGFDYPEPAAGGAGGHAGEVVYTLEMGERMSPQDMNA